MASSHHVNKQALYQLSAEQIAHGYAAQTFTPMDVCESLLFRIEQLNPEINAISELSKNISEQAQASALRWQQQQPLSALDGVPIVIKDNLHAAGLKTIWGSRALVENNISDDEYSVAQCRQAGMIIFAKTNVPELTLDGITDNPVFGVTRNPLNSELTPGGSSGGSVAAVAGFMAPLALGTDGGGSIRRPCAHTGLYGLKPTSEQIPRLGGLPRILLDFEVVGPIARTLADLKLLYQQLVCGLSTPEAINEADKKANKTAIKKIAVVEQLDAQPVDRAILKNLRVTAEQFRTAGFEVVAAELPIDFQQYLALWSKVTAIAVAYAFKSFPQLNEKAQSKFLPMAEAGCQYSAVELMEMWQQVLQMRSQMKLFFTQYDAILMPSIAAPAWPIGVSFPETIDGQKVGPRGHALFTGWVNLTGLPALNFPTGFDETGNAIGLQLIASWQQEMALFNAVEQLQAWLAPAITNQVES